MNIKSLVAITLIFVTLSPQVLAINDNKKKNTNQVQTQNIKVTKDSLLSLDDCISIALQNSPKIKEARYNYQISKSDVGVARSNFFPTIGANAGYTFTDTHTKRLHTDTNAYTINATLNQLIWDFGKTNAGIRMEKFYQIADEYTFYNTVREIIFSVKQKYYQVLAAHATVVINESYVDINERNYQRTKAYYDEGLKSKIDLVNAEVTLSDSKIKLVQSENSYQNAIVELNNAMYLTHAPAYKIQGLFGADSKEIPVDLTIVSKIKEHDSLVGLPEEIEDAKLGSFVEKLDVLPDYNTEKFPYTIRECFKMAEENRADLKAYNYTLEAMKQNLLKVKRNYYPAISGQAGYGFRDAQTTNTFNVGVSISSSLNIMNQKYRTDIAKYQVAIAQNAINQLSDNIYFQVENAYINMVQLERQIPLQAVKVRQTLENYELAEGRYYIGLGDYIELQDAKVNYNNAQRSYIETIYRYNVAKANLESVISMKQNVDISLEDKKNGRK